MKPILFNTEMVRAILDGRKRRTRRIMKPQLTAHYGTQYVKPPYAPGDIMYVRETWSHPIAPSYENKYVYRADEIAEDGFKNDAHIWHPSIHMPKEAARIWLRVTDVRAERLQDMTNDDALKEGAKGVRCDHAGSGAYGCTDCMNTGWLEPPIVEFVQIWDSTIKKSDLDRYGWNANPWVWVIGFERREKPREE